ncbi:hypothetical protein [Prochlorococcus marinus]|uniref:hypothetical protein n=1 Tax=Prochlorococcus marinus TaxID=1219 RepID=UPI00130E8626|nr:hypothetical protein [Prochlorococcus marinus]
MDILKERRKVNNVKKFTYKSIKNNRRKGYFLGLVIAGLSFISCGLFSIHTFKRHAYKKVLLVDVKEYNDLKKTYSDILQQTKTIYNTNKNISQGIIGMKSGSILMTEIKNILPKTIQLKYINSTKDKFELTGISTQPNALDSINALQIKLSNSLLFNSNSVFLTKAWGGKQKDNKTNQLEDILNFNMVAKFNYPSSKIILEKFNRLGSFGLVRRTQLLKDEGLIK